jgi:2-C-methyl-D-erythritol 4-phosphate cytidylyltransferase
MGAREFKQFLLLADKPLLVHTLLRLQESPSIKEIYLIVPRNKIEYCQREMVKQYQLDKVVAVVEGGEERQDSVYLGFQRIKTYTNIVLIHDGVRPFIDPTLVEEVIQKAREYGACVTGIPCSDTIKQVNDQGYIERTLPRHTLWQIHTPQAFNYQILKEALERAQAEGYYATDEASLVERMGYPIKLIKGSPYNIKITSPADLVIGEAFLPIFIKETSCCSSYI